MVKFTQCSSCGCCCRRVGKIISEAKKMIANGNEHPALKEYEIFPYEINENGSCSMLTSDNLCSVYENRPVMCNVSEMYNRYYSPMGEKLFIQALINECNKFIREDGIDETYLIKEI